MIDDLRIRLPDGRRLAYATAGDPDGAPVLLFHGVPGSRLVGLEALAAAPGAAGVLLVAVDRPGIGGSDRLPGRTLLDWPSDVAALADALGWDRFSVLGGSGGGPYALACALTMPDRLRAVVLVNSLAPFDLDGAPDGLDWRMRAAWWLLGHVPGMCGTAARAQARMVRRSPTALPPRMARRMAEVDRRAAGTPAAGEGIGRQFEEAFRQGPGGVARDLHILSRPWGFDLGEVAVTVDLWQGEADRNVPASMGRALTRALPSCRAHYLPGVGHLVDMPYAAEMLAPALE